MKHYNRYPRFWFLRTLRVILREAKLGGRLLCKIGLHNWHTETVRDHPKKSITYNWCDRPFCHYSARRLVGRHEIREFSDDYSST